jgi:dienelactone hydrolase
MATEMTFKRTGESQAVTAICYRQKPLISRRGTKLVVVADNNLTEGYVGYNGEPVGLAAKLLRRGHAVVVIQSFSSGETADQFANFFTTYNRTKLQARVRDLLAVCAGAKGFDFGGGEGNTVLCGVGAAGLWTLMAAPAADAVAADCNTVDALTDEQLLATDLFAPGLRNIGTFEGAAMLAAPNPLLLHKTGKSFPTDGIRSAYQASGIPRKPRIESSRLTDDALVDWISKL